METGQEINDERQQRNELKAKENDEHERNEKIQDAKEISRNV